MDLDVEKLLKNIKNKSIEDINKLKCELKEKFPETDKFFKNVCVYACGSMGRHEMTESSDLDLFFIIMNDKGDSSQLCTNLDKYNFFSKLFHICNNLKYKSPTGNGVYWDFISEKNLLDIGSREEDFNNSFTARLLMILESKPLYNDSAYEKLIDLVIKDKYLRDYKSHCDNFYPLFIMNDILRYWYTLTLNYEYGRKENRSTNKKNWKRLKLKYSRLITCFSLIACLYNQSITPVYLKNCIMLTPFDRLDMVSKSSEDLKKIVNNIKKEYAWFLELRKEKEEWWNSVDNKELAFKKADEFHTLVLKHFMGKIAELNSKLHEKTDMY